MFLQQVIITLGRNRYMENIIEEAVLERKISFSTATREIFFVDDDEEELVIFDLAMKDLNVPFNLQYAKNGDLFFKLLELSTPDLIFLDLHMPGKSGVTILKMLRYNKRYHSIPIIIYSKLSSKSFIDDCYKAKANYYLIKPVSVAKLTKAITKVIETNWDAERYTSRENFVIEE